MKARELVAAMKRHGLICSILIPLPGLVAVVGAAKPVVAIVASACLVLTLVATARMAVFLRALLALKRDPLTGLPTQELLTQELTGAAATPEHPGALLYLDLDRFELANETMGREAGDRLLATVADTLRGALEPNELLMRVGGDEFAILLRGERATDAAQAAERIRRKVGALRFRVGEHVVDVRASIGVASLVGARSSSDALQRAHAACRAAKLRGRNRVEAYRPSLSQEAQHRSDVTWAVRVKDALLHGRVTLAFQPIVRAEDGVVSHYEALVRLVGEDGTLVPAGEFIDAAERCGLIRALDRFVIRETLERLSTGEAARQAARCSINLSGVSVHSDTLEFVREELLRTGVEPSRVTFELTETAAVENIARARTAIERLRGLGCRFALDDFGKGLASFAHLRYLPVDLLKIDGAFVRGLAEDPINRAMVRSMNELAHSLGIHTVAECVENQETLAALREIGIDYVQGYHVGRPTPQMSAPSTDEPIPFRRDAAPRDIVLPPHEPGDIIDLIAFLDQLDARMRELRDTRTIPGTLSRPDEFDDLVVGFVGLMRRQAEVALASGAPLVEIRLPWTEDLERLIDWAEPRMTTIASLAGAGLVEPGWERPFKIMMEFFRATAARTRPATLDEDAPAPVPLRAVPSL